MKIFFILIGILVLVLVLMGFGVLGTITELIEKVKSLYDKISTLFQ